MSRISGCFEALQAKGKKALIPYITAGDPSLEQTLELMKGLVDSGADIIELGVPFSDPSADGPVIQHACERGLASGTTLSGVLDTVKAFREFNTHTPVVLMGYLNPIEIMGYEKFAQKAQISGVDAVLLVDLPPEEAGNFTSLAKQHELDLIFLLAPTTTEERVSLICDQASGFVYYVSITGVTGSAVADLQAVSDKLSFIKQKTQYPVCVGFGIKDGASAKRLSQVSDGVVVGSAIVSRIADTIDQPQKMLSDVTALVKEIRQAIDE